MSDLSSFAISIAANIVCDCLSLELTNVEKEIKAAYKKAIVRLEEGQTIDVFEL